jgi:hypothetical protein
MLAKRKSSTASGSRPDRTATSSRPSCKQTPAFQAVCLGRVAERGDPERSARDTLDHFWAKGWVALKPAAVERIGGEEAFRYTADVPSGRLTEWKFAHDGWLYVVGALNRAPDDAVTIMRARQALATWLFILESDCHPARRHRCRARPAKHGPPRRTSAGTLLPRRCRRAAYSVALNSQIAIPSINSPSARTTAASSSVGTCQPDQVTPGSSALRAASLMSRWLNTRRRIGSTA